MAENTLFIKISNDRADRFCVVTKIIRDEEGKYVLKEPENPHAAAHVMNIEHNGQVLTERYRKSGIRFAPAVRLENAVRIEWVTGRSFVEYLDELLEQGETEACIRSMREYFSQIFSLEVHEYREQPDSEIFFEADRPAEPIRAVNGIDIDMLFQNVIYSETEHTWTDYDYEWVLHCDIPVKFLIYRCLNYYLTTEKRICILTDNLYEQFDISEEERMIYAAMESQLQKFIAGEMIPLWKMYEKVGGPVLHVLPVTERWLRNQRAEVFFDKGQGFTAQNAGKVTVREFAPGKYRAHTAYPEGVGTVRFDPAQSACVLRVKCLKDANGESLPFDTNGLLREQGEYLFLHGDPQILVAVDGTDGYLEIEYEMTIIDAGDQSAQDEMGKCQQEMLSKESECEQLNMHLDAQKSQNENLLKQNANLQAGLSETQQLFLSLTQSTSWKLTEPLRKIGRMARKQKTRVHNYISRRMGKRYLMPDEESAYQNWIEDLERQESDNRELAYQPKISILVPVYNVLDKHLIPCIESVLQQSYPNWELCMADDCSTWDNVRKTLRKYECHEKVKIVYRNENGHISRSTNSALEAATGEFIAFLDCDDVLAPNALYEVAKLLNENPELDFIYSDEDKIDDDGKKRFMPHFKSDWAPDTLMAHMYTCHLGVYRREIAVRIGGIRPGYEGAQDYDFTLRFTEQTDRIAHISKILYHWRVRAESTAGTPEAKPYILEAARKTKEDALVRRHLSGELELIDGIYQYRVNYLCNVWPKVSVVIPSKDNYTILKTCLESFCRLTDYPDYEIIVVDNGSADETREKYQKLLDSYGATYIYQKESFNFSHMCNVGSSAASGEYVLFLNDDIEIIESQWLKRMTGQASLAHIGAVGAKLLYPDRKTIQHVGVINIDNGPVHMFAGFNDEPIYYFGKNRLDYNQIAVTAACLLIKKSKFVEVTGFNEELAIAYNDIELCFHLLQHGYYNIIRNDAVLLHHESVSRGNDLEDQRKFERLMKEQEKLYAMYPEYKGRDPFYNLNLTQNKADFSYGEYRQKTIVNRKTGCMKVPEQMEQNFQVCIDDVSLEEQLVVRGWFYLKNSRCTNGSIIYLLLRMPDGSAGVFDVNRVIRKDVAEAKNSVAYNCGFECRISYDDIDLRKEEYQIGIMVETPGIRQRKVHWTSAKTERCL